MTRALVRLAWFVGFMIFVLPAIERGIKAQGVTNKQFVTPESSVSPVMPTVSLYIPDAVYEKWWAEIAACEHLPLPVAHYQVRWYQVNAPQFYDAAHPTFAISATTGELVMQWAVGISFPRDFEVYIALSQIFNKVVIMHEMLHFLMHWAGEPAGHPAARFETCGISTLFSG